MERVIIIGCGGAGKSTLARQLGEKTGLPVVHLDQLFWKSGWRESTKEEIDGWKWKSQSGSWMETITAPWTGAWNAVIR